MRLRRLKPEAFELLKVWGTCILLRFTHFKRFKRLTHDLARSGRIDIEF